MTRPETPFEAASYDLNKFRERRLTDRRFMLRDTPDRRQASSDSAGAEPSESQKQSSDSGAADQATGNGSGN